jgi:CheY-like chemotaxis protein
VGDNIDVDHRTRVLFPMLIDNRRTRATVLVVEDDDDTRMVYSDGLGFVGYRVLTASSGIEGLRTARDEHPDVILLDLSLAGADGWEVVRCLKASRLTGDIPVLLVTGHTDLSERAEAEGCAGYLTKPIRFETLRRTIESLVGPVS